MKTVRDKPGRGLTLIEVMVAIVIIVVAVIGAMGYRYYCVLDARKADAHITASRLGLMMLESWKAAGGISAPVDSIYNPLNDFSSEFEIYSAAGPGGFSDEFGSYRIVANRSNYFATLSYQGEAVNKLRLLNTHVAWRSDFRDEPLGSEYQLVRMTTYVKYLNDPNS